MIGGGFAPSFFILPMEKMPDIHTKQSVRRTAQAGWTDAWHRRRLRYASYRYGHADMGIRHEDREMRLWSTSPEVDDVGAGSSTCYKGSPQQEGDRRWNAWALPSARRMQESTRGIREDHARCEGDDRRGRNGRGLGVSPIGEPLPSLRSSLCCRGHGLDACW